ncbi:helix-turn-helix domain-containing protein [Rathayibacter sp. VKM Ac-2804]|uniref:helix-turn-helix domain-containing protein n=1 Tax=Rathayibacter sp. VKM Ac-2804 TaxID=2609257 RepID=UPI00132F337B|nr:helix-turn-helix domain-containing protein [Rathayibacter sp. VKM Ac-2804]QHF24125.1 helix-turn-helix domain-containing protein [Rathayibacter sp. VKM Ac-2804]
MAATYLTVEETAAIARKHPETVRELLRSKELHGQQRKVRGPWTVKEPCLEAYLDGEKCEHQRNVTPIRTRRSA